MALTNLQRVMADAMINALKKPAMILFSGVRTGKTFLFTNFEEYMRKPGEKSVEDFEKFLHKKYATDAQPK